MSNSKYYPPGFGQPIGGEGEGRVGVLISCFQN